MFAANFIDRDEAACPVQAHSALIRDGNRRPSISYILVLYGIAGRGGQCIRTIPDTESYPL